MINMDQKTFLSRLSEALSWCSYWIAQGPLTSSPLNDDVLENQLHSLKSNGEIAEVIEKVIAKRRTILLEKQLTIRHLEKVPTELGRILVFARELAFANDGVVKKQSHGLFNFFGFPAPDTWIGYLSTRETCLSSLDSDIFHVFCWIPSAFIEIVDNTIPSNADPSLYWLDNEL